jgi:hypothetical protein
MCCKFLFITGCPSLGKIFVLRGEFWGSPLGGIRDVSCCNIILTHCAFHISGRAYMLEWACYPRGATIQFDERVRTVGVLVCVEISARV